MVLVDSSAWIEAFRRTGQLEVKLALEALLDVYEAQWCSPVRLEVLGGARLEERKKLGHHFSVIPYRSCTEADWDRAVTLAWKLRDGGLTVPWFDIVVASLAIHDNVRLYAIDAHFEEIARRTPLRLYYPGHAGRYEPDPIP